MKPGPEQIETTTAIRLPPAVDLAALVAQAPHAMLVLGLDGRILDANARAEALLNRPADELRGAPFEAFLDETTRADYGRGFALACRPGEAPPDVEARLAQGLVEVTFLPVHDGDRLVLLLLRDLTEELTRREAAASREREVVAENRKMIDLGKLLAGVTHELRTPLTYVANHLSVQRARLEEIAKRDPEMGAALGEVLSSNATAQQGVERVIHIVHELRPLSKNKARRAVSMDLAELVLDAVRTFRTTDGGRTRVALDLQSTHPVSLDREDMVNVLLNLLNNAADAIGRQGVIRVVTRNESVPPEIRVVDQGPGLDPSMAERLFEPFQTTKADGTGLGLFISRRTVESHGGTLTHEPTPGGGATFVVRLPP